MKITAKIIYALASLTLTCFSFLPAVQAVSPAPDGGYPGGNTAEGQNALFSLTTGGFNTAVGLFSLRSNTINSFNTAIGTGALFANTADQNTATGVGALFNNTTGTANTANGTFALFGNTTGNSNTASGLQALFSNTTGSFNNAVGLHALISNTIGIDNNAVGAAALFSNTTGHDNTAIGDLAPTANTTAIFNTATGAGALESNTAGDANTANGAHALLHNTGSANTAVGSQALGSNTTGSFNTALGFSAGSFVTTAMNVICIGSPGADVNNSCFIDNIRNVTTQNGDAIPVLIDSANQLGTQSSSRRYKTDIKPMDKASEAVLALKPVTFRYRNDQTKTRQFGLIAEEVSKVTPDLVVRAKDGEIYTVRYEAVNAMLLNEFLKEHREVAELKSIVAQQQKGFESKLAKQEEQIDALTAAVQKVSAKLEVSKPAARTALNNR